MNDNFLYYTNQTFHHNNHQYSDFHPFLDDLYHDQQQFLYIDFNNSITNISLEDLKEYLETNMGPKYKSLSESIILTIIYSLIFISGIVGNVCTGLIVARRQDMRTTTNFYLCSLAVSDVITLAVGLPQEMYQIWIAYPYFFGTPYCLLTIYLLDMTSSASVFTITAFTVERFFAIKYPFFTRLSGQKCKRVTFIVCLIWLVAAGFSIPFPLHSGYDNYYRILLLVSFTCLFVIPIIIITIFYTLIAMAIRESAQTRNFHRCDGSAGHHANHQAVNTSQSHKAVVKMLIAVVVAFFICWAPFHAQRIMTSSTFDNWSSVAHSIHNGLFYISGVLYYFACTVNPILYNLMSRKYRQAFKETLCRNSCCCRKRSRINVTRYTATYPRSNNFVLCNAHRNASQLNNHFVRNGTHNGTREINSSACIHVHKGQIKQQHNNSCNRRV
ncbi:hypothetical protein HELRODRAFT_74592 [Helobdella robusta]|uniref:G-protein coupled receptors family 1 profile domain-containing protein n=1 Tax=Helobdella robusta TaxID=6412 RepID=T1G1T1_HELRO|nr:hypothetical protein HELRODRAFT_74592 [Helobdella robusta]ESO09025.1 hypothetical protein HELRODRAFT_74592 [Helobdella robusta]